MKKKKSNYQKTSAIIAGINIGLIIIAMLLSLNEALILIPILLLENIPLIIYCQKKKSLSLIEKILVILMDFVFIGIIIYFVPGIVYDIKHPCPEGGFSCLMHGLSAACSFIACVLFLPYIILTIDLLKSKGRKK